jgi:hypothetical protein
VPPGSSLSLLTKPGWISKSAGTPCRAECLDEMPRPWTAITAASMEINTQIIVRTVAAPFTWWRETNRGASVSTPRARF